MKTFKDFGIKIIHQSFVGNKIKVTKILNKEITVYAFKIGPSKHFEGDRLDLQIEVGGIKHVVFTGSTPLIEAIKQIPPSGFPFTTTIVDDNDRYVFT